MNIPRVFLTILEFVTDFDLCCPESNRFWFLWLVVHDLVWLAFWYLMCRAFYDAGYLQALG
jgi:hypothetical protein